MFRPNVKTTRNSTQIINDIIYPLPHVPLKAMGTEVKVQEFLVIDEKKYEIGESLGRGYEGEAFCARDLKTEEYVVVKIKKQKKTTTENKIPDYEYQILQKLNLARGKIIKENPQGDLCEYLVMEYIRGASLFNLLKNDYPIPLQRQIKMAIAAISCLERLHKKGILHDDLKPEHLFMFAGLGFLLDFGFSRETKEFKESKDVQIKGFTDVYAPPETKSFRIYSEKADIYMLGLVIACIFQLWEKLHKETKVSDTHLKYLVYQNFIPPAILHDIYARLKDMTAYTPSERPELSSTKIFFEDVNRKLAQGVYTDGKIKLIDATKLSELKWDSDEANAIIKDLKKDEIPCLVTTDEKATYADLVTKLSYRRIYVTKPIVRTSESDEQLKAIAQERIHKAIHSEPCGILFVEDFLEKKVDILALHKYDFVCLADNTGKYEEKIFKEIIKALREKDLDVLGQFINNKMSRAELTAYIKQKISDEPPSLSEQGLFMVRKKAEQSSSFGTNCRLM